MHLEKDTCPPFLTNVCRYKSEHTRVNYHLSLKKNISSTAEAPLGFYPFKIRSYSTTKRQTGHRNDISLPIPLHGDNNNNNNNTANKFSQGSEINGTFTYH